jgi:CSLREA domain-containing protein
MPQSQFHHRTQRAPQAAPRRRAATRPALEGLEDRLAPATLTVTTAADELTPNDGTVSLREALTAINAGNNLGDPDIVNTGAAFGTNDTIDFNIGTGVQTISLLAALPIVTAPVTIDGTSEPDFAGTPEIVLDGTSAGAVAGLTITAGNSTVRGLVIDNFTGDGIDLTTRGGDVLAGNYIGVDSTGAAAAGNGGHGVAISSAPNNTIGGTTAGAGNVISANALNGVLLTAPGTSGNVIEGNDIGTDVTGTQALGNGGGTTATVAYSGVLVINGAHDNLIGGTGAGAGNLISGNVSHAVEINGVGTTGNRVQGNFLGTDVTGAVALGNGQDGIDSAVSVDSGASNNTIGGTASGARNLISGNVFNGLSIFGSGTSGNAVQGNFIGTDVSGSAALGNGTDGISIHDGAANNTVIANVISANAANGVDIFTAGAATTGNLVQGNSIGTDVGGTANLGNGANGVLITTASGNSVGGTASGQANVIAFSGNDGVKVDTGTGNAVRANSIHDSGHLGIELVNGGNANQAAPALSSATVTASSITIRGTLTGAASTSYALDFFASPTANASGFGEGQRWVGSATVTTTSGGTANFTLTFSVTVPAGQAVSATATSPANNTSAFAQDVTAATATALVITPTFDSSITGDPNAAVIEATINAAIQAYESTYSNPITVRIDFKEMSGGLGASTTGVVYDATYASFRSRLAANQMSSGQADQATALAHLPVQTNNPVTGNPDLAVTPADGRALGLNTPGLLDSNGNVNTGGNFDGIIWVNPSITFPPQPNNGSTYSLMAVSEHEIDEVLGSPSALPSPPNFGRGATPLAVDLYRYNGSGARSFTTATTTAFFSIDGTTNLVQYHNTNDGADYGDWQNQGGNPRVQDAFGTPGATPSLGVELTLLDVIGYDRFSPGAAAPNRAGGGLPAGPVAVALPSTLAQAGIDLPRSLPGLPPPAAAANGAATERGAALPLPAEMLLGLARGPAAFALAGPPAAPAASAAGAGVTGALDRFLAAAADDLSAALAGAHAAPADSGPPALPGDPGAPLWSALPAGG